MCSEVNDNDSSQLNYQLSENHLHRISRNSVVTVNLCKTIHPTAWNVKKWIERLVTRPRQQLMSVVWYRLKTQMWSLPSRQVFLFHHPTTNLANTAHLSTHSPPHILYCEISIVFSCRCFLSVFVWLESTLRGLQTLRECWSYSMLGSCLTSIWTCLQCIFSHCVFPLYTVYSHTVIHGILEK